MRNQSTICLTGFNMDPKLETHKKYIQSLHCNHVGRMCETTQLLIVKNTATEKYKIAKLNRSPISCVTINWLTDSHRKKKILPFNTYEIPHIFYGVNICLAGFTNEETENLKKRLTDNGAIVQIYGSLAEIKELEEVETTCDAIVTTDKQILRIGSNAASITIPLVGIQWIQMSLKRKMCKWPRDYALNYEFIRRTLKNHSCEIPKLNDKLRIFLERDLFDRQFEYLNGVRIFMDQGVNYKVSSLLKKIVCVCGGLYLNSFSQMVTHVLTSSITENNYNKYLKFGNVVKIVRVQWLIDSIYLYKNLEEEDYTIKQFESKYTRESGEIQLNRVHSASFNTNPLQLMRQTSRNSISINYEISQKPKVQNVTTKFKSTIFKGHNFYIDPSHKKEHQMYKLGTKIRENGGLLYDGISKSYRKMFVVLKDSQQNDSILLKFDKFKEVISPVSFRWVNYCVDSGTFYQPSAPSYYTFRPLSMKIPNKDFMGYKFELLTKDDVAKRRIRELLNVLGSVYVSSVNRVDLTHCICLSDYKMVGKYLEIKKANPNVKFVKFQWVLGCLNERKVIDTDDYLCDQ